MLCQFFCISLLLLQELTCCAEAAEAEVEDRQEVDISAMTLLEVEQHLLGDAERQGRRLALLQVLAVMVESVQHSVMLRKNIQVSEKREQKRYSFFNVLSYILFF